MMLIEQIPVHNSLRNYMYLLGCDQTGEAAAIDPLDHQRCLETAQRLGWNITKVINSHEHHDHIGGNKEVITATGATLYAHHQALDVIPDVDVGVCAGDIITVGRSVRLSVMDTPGHTFCHSCFYCHGDDTVPPALFSGDTVFNAGVGNCHGGDAEVMYETFAQQIFVLPDSTRIYPGHDYIENNLRFTLAREPDNVAAQSLLSAMEQWQNEPHFIADIALERKVNTFFRLGNTVLINHLRKEHPAFPEKPDEKTVFLKLRELRDFW